MNESTDNQVARTSSDRHVIIQIIKCFYFNLEVTKGGTFSNFCLALKPVLRDRDGGVDEKSNESSMWTLDQLGSQDSHEDHGQTPPVRLLGDHVFPAYSETFRFDFLFVCLK